jgi:hypothetical protein
VLLERTNGDFAVAASPDGRYLLVLTEVQQDPPFGASGRWTILDRSTGKVTEGPQGVYQRVFGWSGRGFWLDPLTHMDLQGQIDHHEALAQLAKDAQIVGVAWQADGSHVALVIKPEDLERADLLWATADGRVLDRADGVVQPFWSKQGAWTELALSPDSQRLYLRAAYPGTALIETEALAFEKWRSLNGEWHQGDAQGGGAPATLWSPDGRFLYEGARRLFDREGSLLRSFDTSLCMGTWLPDSAGLLCTSEWANDRLGSARRISLDGQSEGLPYAIGGQVLGWLPDGRLLVGLLIL